MFLTWQILNRDIWLNTLSTGTILENPPVELNVDIALEDPFKLKTWIAENHSQLDEDGFIPVYGDPYQFQVIIQGIQ